MNDHAAGMRALQAHPDGGLASVRVAVLGAGLMGHSIAGIFAAGLSEVRLFDPVKQARDSATAKVANQLRVLGHDPALADHIELDDDLALAVCDADLIIEAAPENLGLKQDLVAQANAIAPGAVIATNTSSFTVTDVASQAPRPERVVAGHWWNPPHLIPLVEVVASPHTAPDVVSWFEHVLRAVGKVPVRVRRDVPGLIGNRMQHALWREAVALVADGVCDAAAVDSVVRNSFGLRLAAMGPLENADYIGLDLTIAIHDSVLASLSRDVRGNDLLRAHVAEGRLGAKSGEGFFVWAPGDRRAAEARLTAALVEHHASRKPT